METEKALNLLTNSTGMSASPFIPYVPTHGTAATHVQHLEQFYQLMRQRRSLRFFSDRQVPKSTIETLILSAGTAPSGAHKQPWTFCAISSPSMKQSIREAAEKEEYENYHGRMSDSWLKDLEPFGTNWEKPFLETAPWLIVVFKKAYDFGPDGTQQKHYYVNESVGIACGLLIAAIQHAGLVTLTHTPSPMNFLQQLLGRPENERPYLLIPVGYPAEDAVVPDLQRKPLSEISVWYE